MQKNKNRFNIHKNLEHDNAKDMYDNMSCCVDETKDWEVYKWIHDNLTIIDGKCASLLQIASIILTVLAITYSFIIGAGERGTLELVIKAVLLIPLVLLTYTILSLLKILYVHWDGPDDFLDIKETIQSLYILRNRRSIIIRVSVISSGVSLVIIVSVLALYLFIA